MVILVGYIIRHKTSFEQFCKNMNSACLKISPLLDIQPILDMKPISTQYYFISSSDSIRSPMYSIAKKLRLSIKKPISSILLVVIL